MTRTLTAPDVVSWLYDCIEFGQDDADWEANVASGAGVNAPVPTSDVQLEQDGLTVTIRGQRFRITVEEITEMGS